MSDEPPTLSYLHEPPPPRQLVLEEMEGQCRLTFPLPSKWLIWFVIGMTAACGSMIAVGAIMQLRSMFLLRAMLPGSSPTGVWLHGFLIPILMTTCEAGFWWTISILKWIHYRRYGQIPQMLELDADGLTYRRQKFFGIRHRHWPLAEINRAEVRPLKSVFPGQPVASFFVVAPGWGYPHFRVHGQQNIETARRFAEFINKAAKSKPPAS